MAEEGGGELVEFGRPSGEVEGGSNTGCLFVLFLSGGGLGFGGFRVYMGWTGLVVRVGCILVLV